MSKRKKKTQFDKFEEDSAAKKGIFRWQMLTLLASVIAIISLFGIWYANNEKAFLEIENKKLAVEAENLKEEIEVLQNTIAQKGYQVENTVEPYKPDKPDELDEPVAENQPQENQPAEVSYDEYTVQPGDTLGGISVSLFGTESYISQIAELNGINAESLLQIGQKIKVPKKPDA